MSLSATCFIGLPRPRVPKWPPPCSSRSSWRHLIRALQDRGLVTRPAMVSSERSLPATLTRKGVTMLERLDPKMDEAEDRVLGNLSEQDRCEFRRLLVAVGSGLPRD
jgi:DNA-binding MarR family transcriptional regulator